METLVEPVLALSLLKSHTDAECPEQFESHPMAASQSRLRQLSLVALNNRFDVLQEPFKSIGAHILISFSHKILGPAPHDLRR